MESHLDNKIRLINKENQNYDDSWFLQEINSEGEQVGGDFTPWVITLQN